MVVWLAACGNVTSDGGADAANDDPADAGAQGDEPMVVSVTPDDGATGVGPDAEIVVVFNVAMNQESVEAAWASSDLPAAEVVFSWNAAGDTLTVTPMDEMPVAEVEGLDPSGVDPLTIEFDIGAEAMDLEGIALVPFTAAFTTQRRLQVELSSVQELTNSVFDDGTPVDPPSISAGASGFGLFWRLLVTFDLPVAPSGASLERAVLSAEQEEVDNTPYQTLGNLEVFHVTFSSLNLAALQVTPLASPGAFSTDASLGAKSIDVSAQVVDDFANRASRNGRSQYRLQFETENIADETIYNAIFGSTSAAEYRSTFKLGLDFLTD